MIKSFLTFLSLLITHTVYILSSLTPRSKKIYICIGWHNTQEREVFADNAKYFFLYLHHQQPEVTSIWIAKDRHFAKMLRKEGYRAYYAHSPQGIYFALRAQYTILDARISRINWKFSKGSTLVQLWHGKGMKKSGHNSSYNSRPHYFTNPTFYTKHDILFATSSYTASLLANTFDQSVSDIKVTGHPRTDVFLKSITGADIDTNPDLVTILGSLQHISNKIIYYAPTFRADGSNPLEQIDFKRLNDVLRANNFHFIIGLHPKFAFKNIDSNKQYSHIYVIQPGFDNHPLFHIFDLVITDYSNIYMDFLLLDTPLIFFTYDKDMYAKTTGLYEDYTEMTPGPHVSNHDDLLEAITLPDTHQTHRKIVCNKIYAYSNSPAAEKIFQEIQKI